MATTLQTDRTDDKIRYRICFKSIDGQRRRIRLMSGTLKRDAETVRTRIKELLSARANNGTLPPALLEWLASVPLELRNKLRDADLLPEHVAGTVERLTIQQWFDRYLKFRPDIKGGTREQIEISGRNLVAFFGADHPVDRVTVSDAKRWRAWMLTSGRVYREISVPDGKRDKTEDTRSKALSEATVRRRTGRAKQVFAAAVERGMIVKNPFAILPCASRVNTARQQFIDKKTIDTVIDHAPSIDWRTIIALARFGGLRIPSELSTLRWDRVNLHESRMMVQAPKTEHHSDGGMRMVPIFPELRPYLEEAWDAAPAGALFVINDPKLRCKRANLGTGLRRIIDKACVERWPKAFQNLRATRETELLAKYPAKDVAAWIGNTVEVAMKHYAMATSEQFERAARDGVTEPDPTRETTAEAKNYPNETSPVGNQDELGVGQHGGANSNPHPATEHPKGVSQSATEAELDGSCSLLSLVDSALNGGILASATPLGQAKALPPTDAKGREKPVQNADRTGQPIIGVGQTGGATINRLLPHTSTHATDGEPRASRHAPSLDVSDPMLCELLSCWQSIDDSARIALLGVARSIAKSTSQTPI